MMQAKYIAVALSSTHSTEHFRTGSKGSVQETVTNPVHAHQTPETLKFGTMTEDGGATQVGAGHPMLAVAAVPQI